MKKYLSLFIIILITGYIVFMVKGGADSSQKINWVTLEEAQQLSAKEPKKIFVDIVTDWCGFCKKMDKETFRDTSIVNYINKNYYAVKLDAESTKKITYKGVKATYADIAFDVFKVKVYPTIVLMNSDFNRPMSAEGYMSKDKLEEFMMAFEKGI